MSINKLRFEVKAKNNRLHKEIYSRHKNLQEFCSLENIMYHYVCGFINLSINPYHSCGMNKWAMRLCEIFSMEPETLFPPEIYKRGQVTKWVIESNLKNIAIGINDMPKVEYINEDKIQSETQRGVIKNQLKTINKKHASILEMRMGFTTGEPETLETCARHFNLSEERIRQIEAKCIRVLRHPSRAKHLIGI